ncbi:MAG: radical SAM protein [Deltaproteobacteria bacterium]|nr:radical SAM protein [Deltaproteobacteria bacterium]
MPETLNHLELYRLPWNLCDNGISWLEPTSQCNLSCDGCYRDNRVLHKTVEQTMRDLDVFMSHRKSDALSIAGGDPLLYPDLIRTVSEAKARGYKPVVNTNGHALTKELLKELKAAGLTGFTFHVDSKQGRPGWKRKNELELCALRDELAEMAASIDVSCAFNATIYPDTKDMVVPLTRWAEERIDKVQVMVFILYRDVRTQRFQYFNEDQEVGFGVETEAQQIERKRKTREGAIYNVDKEKSYEEVLGAREIVALLEKAFPDFKPSAYLNGTEDPKSFKWLLSTRLGRPGKVLGYVGPKFQELTQTFHHLVTDRYLAYAPRSATRAAKPALLLSPFDRGVRGIVGSFLADAVAHPIRALMDPLYAQSVLIIQPIDMLDDGRMNMCDGCPDITVHDEKLVWSCRMDEQERYGRNLWARPRSETTPA